MRRLIARSLRTSLTWSLLLSLTLIAAAVNSAAQAVFTGRPPGMAGLSGQRPWQGTSQPSQLPQVLSSVPTWSPLFPTANDPDLSPFRATHSAVYDPSSNTMVVFGGFDPTFTPQSSVLVESNANGIGGAFAGTWSELNLSFPSRPRAFTTARCTTK